MEKKYNQTKIFKEINKEEKKALLVIDMQNDYLWDKRKPMFTYNTEELVGNVNKAIETYEKKGYDIIYIKHILPNTLITRCFIGFSIKGTEGTELYSGLKIVSNLIFKKNLANTYSSKAFRDYMKKQKYTEVVICGIDECACVGATAKGAVKTGASVIILENCIETRFFEKKVIKIRNKLTSIGVKYIK